MLKFRKPPPRSSASTAGDCAGSNWRGASAASAEAGSERFGFWRNPKDNVRIEIRPCGVKTCGYIIAASEKTKVNAAKHGIDDVIGLQILRDFTPNSRGGWKGKVFAPDIGMTFAGTANFPDSATLDAKGCVIGNFLCKEQRWKRVDGLAGWRHPH